MILYTEPGNISPRQVKRLETAGVTVVLVKDSSLVRVLGAEQDPHTLEILDLMIAAIRNSTVASEAFGNKLFDKLCRDTGYYDRSRRPTK